MPNSNVRELLNINQPMLFFCPGVDSCFAMPLAKQLHSLFDRLTRLPQMST